MQTTGTLAAVFDEDLKESADLDLRSYDVMLHTFEAREPGIRMTDLARDISISKAGLTSMVDRLEQRSILQRIPDPDDRRAIRIKLTDHGETVFRAAAKVHVAGIEEHFTRHLTEDEARVIAETLERIRQLHLDTT